MMAETPTNIAAPSLNICFISRALPVHRLGGLEHHLRDLALALARRGHAVHILTTTGGAADAVRRDSAATVTVSELPGAASGDYSYQFFRKLRPAVAALQEREGFDVVIPVEFAGLFLARQIGPAPVVPLIHGTMATETPLHRRYWRRLSWSEKLKTAWRFKARIALVPCFWRMVARAPGIIVDSEFTRRELMKGSGDGFGEVGKKTYVVPLGIDLERFPGSESAIGASLDNTVERDGQECLSHAPLRICLLGRLQKMKGIDIAIRAAAQLRLRGVAFHMTIGGTGDHAAKAAALLSKLFLENEVQLAGRIAPERLPDFFREHDVFLFPDLTQPAFGLVAVEAMAYGLPVVAARSGAIPEVATTGTGWLYEAWNVGELAALLAAIAKDRRSIVMRSMAARKRLAYYMADAMAERTEAALLDILEKSAAAGK